MEKPNSTGSTRNRLRVLRPLIIWFGFVLILFCIHQYDVWIDKTRIYFSLTMDGKKPRPEDLASVIDFGASPSLDGRPILNGSKIRFGKHLFTVTHPLTEPFSTNLFVVYGAQDLGTIDLKRASRRVTIIANPPAPLISVTGSELTTNLTNCSQTTLTVPTGPYKITAR